MKGSRSFAAMAVAVAVLGVGVAGAQDGTSPTIHACQHRVTGALRAVGGPDDCRPQELPLSWNEVGPEGVPGPQGEPGATGPQGPAGPAGRARAVGSVVVPTNGGPFLRSEGLVGWTAVERSPTGAYCLTADPSITRESAALVLSAGSAAGGGANQQLVWVGYCSINPLKFQVVTDGNAFTAMIP